MKSITYNIGDGLYVQPVTYIQITYNSYFDGTNYSKWIFDIKMHLYGLDPSVWKVVCVGVTPPVNSVSTTEQVQDI